MSNTKDDELKIMREIQDAVKHMRAIKPGDRSERDRYFAICITQLEIALAIFKGLIIIKDIINE